MNEDIKILRDALANMASFVERKDAHLTVPLQLDSSTRAQYREACDPDRIRRLLDDAERYQHIKPMVRVMSLDMGGQHYYAMTGQFARMRGPSLDAAIDADRKDKE